MCVLHGSDSFRSIGMPDGSTVTDSTSAVEAWRHEVARVFPEPKNAATVATDLAALPADASAPFNSYLSVTV